MYQAFLDSTKDKRVVELLAKHDSGSIPNNLVLRERTSIVLPVCTCEAAIEVEGDKHGHKVTVQNGAGYVNGLENDVK
jgi:hypothetical protein